MESDATNAIYEIVVCDASFAPSFISQTHSKWTSSIEPNEPVVTHARNEAIYAVHSGIRDNGHVFESSESLVRTTINALLQRELCGLGRDQFAAADTGLDNLNYCATIIEILSLSMYTLSVLSGTNDTIRHSSEFMRNVKSHTILVFVIWGKIWKARRTVMSSDATLSFQMALIKLLGASLELFGALPIPEFPRGLETSSALPLLMDVWLKSSGHDARFHAIDVIDGALAVAQNGSSGAHKRFYTTNPRFSKYIVRAGLRDLRSPSNNRHILALLDQMPIARCLSRGVEVSEAVDHKVFQASLASFRTLMCTEASVNISNSWYSDYIRLGRGGNPRSNPMLAEEDLFQIVYIVKAYLEGTLELSGSLRKSKAILEETHQLLMILCHKVENRHDTLVGSEMTGRRRAYLRSFSRPFWSSTVTQVRQRLSLKNDRLLQRVLNAYIRFGHLLGLDDPANASPSPTLNTDTSYRVCQWKDCLCSAYKPIHKLRACNGCNKAVYCHKSCQQRDWTQCGHRKVCGVSQAK